MGLSVALVVQCDNETPKRGQLQRSLGHELATNHLRTTNADDLIIELSDASPHSISQPPIVIAKTMLENRRLSDLWRACL